MESPEKANMQAAQEFKTAEKHIHQRINSIHLLAEMVDCSTKDVEVMPALLRKHGVYDAYHTEILEKLDLSLTESIIILSEIGYDGEIDLIGWEKQVEATCRHAAIAYGTLTRRIAEDKYGVMWREWLHGGDLDIIFANLTARTGENRQNI